MINKWPGMNCGMTENDYISITYMHILHMPRVLDTLKPNADREFTVFPKKEDENRMRVFTHAL